MNRLKRRHYEGIQRWVDRQKAHQSTKLWLRTRHIEMGSTGEVREKVK